MYCFFSVIDRTNGLVTVVKPGRREPELGDLGLIPDELCRASAILRGTQAELFILLRSLYFFFLGFRQWRSRADRVVNLNTTMFWIT